MRASSGTERIRSWVDWPVRSKIRSVTILAPLTAISQLVRCLASSRVGLPGVAAVLRSMTS